MTNQPLVSILMNCYNGEKYLKEAIDSVYAQTYKDWEIIFVDNCSIDESSPIAKSYDDGRLKYYKTERNILLGAARNWGLQYVSGEFLAFLDTDDIWYSNKLEKQLEVIDDNIAFVYSPVIQINDKGEFLRETKINKKNDFKSLLERYDINMHTTLINLKLVKVKFNEELSYCPDYELFMSIVSENKKFVFINLPLVKYRIHANSLSTKTADIQMKEIVLVLEKLKSNISLYNEYQDSFDICVFKFEHLLEAKKLLSTEKFYLASKELFLLSKVSNKYFVVSIILMIPFLNKFFYNKFLYKYV